MGRLALIVATGILVLGCGDDDEKLPDAAINSTADAMVVVVPDAATPDAMSDAAVNDAMQDAMVNDAMFVCPDLIGEYRSTAGAGCPTHEELSSQFIAAGTSTCTIDFNSTPSKTLPFLNSGDILIDSSGNFSGATITFGATDEPGCDGVWNAALSQLVITCTSGCTATITRI